LHRYTDHDINQGDNMQKPIQHGLIALALSAFALSAWAQSAAVGVWRTIDDETKTAKSHVRIAEANGSLEGTVVEILDPAKRAEICTLCTDERKDKPKLGMVILRKLKAESKDGSEWGDGEILDPNNGKTYRASIKVIEGGKKLQVRGYIAFFYRTQVWERVE